MTKVMLSKSSIFIFTCLSKDGVHFLRNKGILQNSVNAGVDYSVMTTFKKTCIPREGAASDRGDTEEKRSEARRHVGRRLSCSLGELLHPAAIECSHPVCIDQNPTV